MITEMITKIREQNRHVSTTDETEPPVVWALDAFSRDFATQLKTAEAIRAHAPESPIHPVYVLSEDVFAHRGYSSFLRAALRPRAHKNIEAVLNHESMTGLRKSGQLQAPRILMEATADAAKCTKKVLRYAKRIGAHLIALSTHGRSPLSRGFAGSFANTIMQHSSIPLLITGPRQSEGLKTPRTLIIPTDFQTCDFAPFQKLLEFAQRHAVTVHFIEHHHLNKKPDLASLAVDFLVSSGFALANEPADDLRSSCAENKSLWLALAKARGVHVEIVKNHFHDSVASTLSRYAVQVEDPVIALLGLLPHGLTRDLIRTSPVPIFLSGLGSTLS